MAAIQITISSQLQTQFSQRYVKIYKNINDEMLEDGAKLLRIPIFFCHDCMLNILNNFCIITIGAEL